MNEYTFFDLELEDRFVARLEDRGIACTRRDDPAGGRQVAIADDLDDNLLDELEALYDELLLAQSLRVESEGLVNRRVVGIPVTLADGSSRTVRLSAEWGGRLLAAFTTDEVRALVTAIADSLTAPEEPRLCREPGANN